LGEGRHRTEADRTWRLRLTFQSRKRYPQLRSAVNLNNWFTLRRIG
jgi:hypothetical protein